MASLSFQDFLSVLDEDAGGGGVGGTPHEVVGKTPSPLPREGECLPFRGGAYAGGARDGAVHAADVLEQRGAAHHRAHRGGGGVVEPLAPIVGAVGLRVAGEVEVAPEGGGVVLQVLQDAAALADAHGVVEHEVHSVGYQHGLEYALVHRRAFVAEQTARRAARVGEGVGEVEARAGLVGRFAGDVIEPSEGFAQRALGVGEGRLLDAPVGLRDAAVDEVAVPGLSIFEVGAVVEVLEELRGEQAGGREGAGIGL